MVRYNVNHICDVHPPTIPDRCGRMYRRAMERSPAISRAFLSLTDEL